MHNSTDGGWMRKGNSPPWEGDGFAAGKGGSAVNVYKFSPAMIGKSIPAGSKLPALGD